METIEYLLMMMCSRSLSEYVHTFGIVVAAAASYPGMHMEKVVGLERICYD